MPRGIPSEETQSRRSRRHDPDDAPVDGDYAKDKVYGVPSGYRAVLASDEDLPRMLHRGAEVVRRAADGPKPAYDIGSGEGEAIKVDNLTLMLISEENAQRAERPGRLQAERRMSALRKNAVKSGPMARIYEDDGQTAGYSRTRV